MVIYQILWDTLEAVLQAKCIALYIGPYHKISGISNKQSNFQLKELEKQTKPKISRRKEIIKIKTKINEMENKKFKRSVKPKLILFCTFSDFCLIISTN